MYLEDEIFIECLIESKHMEPLASQGVSVSSSPKQVLGQCHNKFIVHVLEPLILCVSISMRLCITSLLNKMDICIINRNFSYNIHIHVYTLGVRIKIA